MKADTFKDINLGTLIKHIIYEKEIEISRVCKFLKASEDEVEQMYQAKSLDTEVLLRWCKLLEYDFFRIYSQHLILYAPPAKIASVTESKNLNLPQFKKNIYTREIIDFILSLIDSGEMNKNEIIETYRIPKTTLYRWIEKYKDNGTKT